MRKTLPQSSQPSVPNVLTSGRLVFKQAPVYECILTYKVLAMELSPSEIRIVADLTLAARRTGSVNYPNLDARHFRFRRTFERDAIYPFAFRTPCGVGYKLRANVEFILAASASR